MAAITTGCEPENCQVITPVTSLMCSAAAHCDCTFGGLGFVTVKMYWRTCKVALQTSLPCGFEVCYDNL